MVLSAWRSSIVLLSRTVIDAPTCDSESSLPVAVTTMDSRIVGGVAGDGAAGAPLCVSDTRKGKKR
jgi:hypothetical protein